MIRACVCGRLDIVGHSTTALKKALGPHCPAVGLGTLGTAAVHRTWTDAEEALLEEGMRAWGRDFRQVYAAMLPGTVSACCLLDGCTTDIYAGSM